MGIAKRRRYYERQLKTGAGDSPRSLRQFNYQSLVPQRLHRLQIRGAVRGINPEEQTHRRGEEGGKQNHVATHAGIIKYVLRLFDELAKCDAEGILKDVRSAAEGRA